MEEKKRLEIDLEKAKSQRQREKLLAEEEFENEKREIINEYTFSLRNFEAEDKCNQEQEVIEYRELLKEKIVEEKKVKIKLFNSHLIQIVIDDSEKAKRVC